MGGGSKFLLDLHGRPLIGHAVERLAPQVETLAISANCDPDLLPPGIVVIADAPPSRGPLSGLLSGLEWAAGSTAATHLVTAAADTPFFPADLVARLASGLAGGHGAALAASRGRTHPTFGLWPAGCAESLRRFLETGGSRVAEFASLCEAVVVDFGDDDDDPFFNVNEPADLARARLRAAS